MSRSEREDNRGGGRVPVRWSALFGHLVRVRIGVRFQSALIALLDDSLVTSNPFAHAGLANSFLRN